MSRSRRRLTTALVRKQKKLLVVNLRENYIVSFFFFSANTPVCAGTQFPYRIFTALPSGFFLLCHAFM